jgi:2-dehydropantoate 2-reductase
MSPRPEHVLVFGTGVMGSWLAARLEAPGAARVTVAGRWAAGREAIARGIHVQEPGRVVAARPAVADLDGALPAADFALVLVKSHQTAAVAPAAARAVTDDGRIVTLQNGLGNREALAAAAGAGRVRAGIVTAGVRRLDAQTILALPGTLTLECPPDDAAMARLAALLERAGLAPRRVADIETEQWRKLAVNCAINPLSATLRVTNGALLAHPQAWARMRAAALEVAAVASARGLALGDVEAAALEVARLTAGNRSSMLQDLDRGSRTEIDALCGAVVREGRRLGVGTPVNERLWREVQDLEQAATVNA